MVDLGLKETWTSRSCGLWRHDMPPKTYEESQPWHYKLQILYQAFGLLQKHNLALDYVWISEQHLLGFEVKITHILWKDFNLDWLEKIEIRSFILPNWTNFSPHFVISPNSSFCQLFGSYFYTFWELFCCRPSEWGYYLFKALTLAWPHILLSIAWGKLTLG